jgi:hypothetical protein
MSETSRRHVRRAPRTRYRRRQVLTPPPEQLVGVNAVRLRDLRHRRAGHQGLRDELLLEVGGVAARSLRSGRDNQGIRHRCSSIGYLNTAEVSFAAGCSTLSPPSSRRPTPDA